MKVLLFGGTGFVGKNLIRELLAKKYQVYLMARNLEKAANIFGEDVKLIKWDYDSPIPINDEIKDVYAVVNLAGESIANKRWTDVVKQRILQSRIKTTKAVALAINNKQIKTRVLINASAVGYYGSRDDELIKENEKAGNGFLAEVAKKWEEEAYKINDSSIRVVTLRTAVVLGDEGALDKMVLPFKMYVGGPLGTGNQWFPWIHINDLVRLIIFIIDNEGLNGPVNAAAPGILRMKDFTKVLGKVLNRPSWLPVPEVFLKIGLGQMSEMLLYGQKAVPDKILKAGFVFKFPDLEKALNNIYKDA